MAIGWRSVRTASSKAHGTALSNPVTLTGLKLLWAPVEYCGKAARFLTANRHVHVAGIPANQKPPADCELAGFSLGPGRRQTGAELPLLLFRRDASPSLGLAAQADADAHSQRQYA